MKSVLRELSRRMAGFLGLAALVGGISLLAPAVHADDEGDPGSAQPARAVRLSFVQGEVHLFQGSQPLADQALVNTPLFEGFRIDTGNDGRAEIQFEDGSVARLSPETSLTLSELRGLSANAQRDAELVLNSGLAYFELQGDSDSNHTRIRFGDAGVTASAFTVLRINLDRAPGEVAVLAGNAHIEGGPTPATDLHGGESLNAGNGSVAESIEPDSWDTWNSDRDQELTAAAAAQTAATENLPDNKNPAWGDLDANGNWYDVPDQGYVWSPNEASSPDWDPYDNGHWMDSPAYGYMWVSGYPWGYMPYSCGAWNYYSTFGWGWAPGGCNPWWGGYGGWNINIGFAPPRYRYPVRPRPRNPRPITARHTPQPLIPVNRRGGSPTITAPAPRGGGSVLIAGRSVTPLRPIQQQPRTPYHQPVNSSGPIYTTRQGNNPPGGTSNPPRSVFQGGYPSPRPIERPTRPVDGYAPAPAPRPAPTYNPRPAPTYNPPPRPSGGSAPRSAPSAPPARSSPPPAPSHSGGGGGGGGGSHPSGGPHR